MNKILLTFVIAIGSAHASEFCTQDNLAAIQNNDLKVREQAVKYYTAQLDTLDVKTVKQDKLENKIPKLLKKNNQKSGKAEQIQAKIVDLTGDLENQIADIDNSESSLENDECYKAMPKWTGKNGRVILEVI